MGSKKKGKKKEIGRNYNLEVRLIHLLVVHFSPYPLTHPSPEVKKLPLLLEGKKKKQMGREKEKKEKNRKKFFFSRKKRKNGNIFLKKRKRKKLLLL